MKKLIVLLFATAYCIGLIGCHGISGSASPGTLTGEAEQTDTISPSPMVTLAPGELPDPSSLPEIEDSLVGSVVTVNCGELDNSIFRAARQDDVRIIIIKVDATKNNSLGEPTIVTVYFSVDEVESGDIGNSIINGIECVVGAQRYIHGYAWMYYTNGFWSLTHPYYPTDKLSDDSCYGYIKPGEILTINDNFFDDCEASRNGIEDVFRWISEHYSILEEIPDIDSWLDKDTFVVGYWITLLGK